MIRKTVTVFCADVVGFSKMMGLDEEGTLDSLDECRSIIDPMISSYGGRIFGSAGDSVLAEFPEAVDCVKFAIQCQEALHRRNLRTTPKPSMQFRFGIHRGEVIVQGDNLMGDVVNLGARIESMADYGGISMSSVVYEAIKGPLAHVTFVDTGPRSFKNIKDPVKIFAIPVPGSRPNPNANASAVEAKTADKFSNSEITETTSTADVLKVIAKDQSKAEVPVSLLKRLRNARAYDQVIKVLLAKTVRNKDRESLRELIHLALERMIPSDQKRAVAAVFEAAAGVLMDHSQQTQIGNLLHSGYLGERQKSVALHLWKHAAERNPAAQLSLGFGILDLPHPSANDVAYAIKLLETAARQKNVKAVMRLAVFYSDPANPLKDKAAAFNWYWVGRHLKDPEAQAGLERVVTTVSRNEFPSFKINAEALLEEISWSARQY